MLDMRQDRAIIARHNEHYWHDNDKPLSSARLGDSYLHRHRRFVIVLGACTVQGDDFPTISHVSDEHIPALQLHAQNTPYQRTISVGNSEERVSQA